MVLRLTGSAAESSSCLINWAGFDSDVSNDAGDPRNLSRLLSAGFDSGPSEASALRSGICLGNLRPAWSGQGRLC